PRPPPPMTREASLRPPPRRAGRARARYSVSGRPWHQKSCATRPNASVLSRDPLAVLPDHVEKPETIPGQVRTRLFPEHPLLEVSGVGGAPSEVLAAVDREGDAGHASGAREIEHRVGDVLRAGTTLERKRAHLPGEGLGILTRARQRRARRHRV